MDWKEEWDQPNKAHVDKDNKNKKEDSKNKMSTKSGPSPRSVKAV